jgi:phenylacetate-CoA ligase
MLEKIYKIAPHFIQNLFITGFNYLSYKKRYGGNYKEYLKLYQNNANLSINELKAIQEREFLSLIKHAKTNSKFYKQRFKNCNLPKDISEIHKLPIIKKEELRQNINNVYTIDKKKGIISKTGGTTGKSLEVIFTKDDMQKRFAMLDYFRSWYGYKLGKKTAWFSGKALLTHKDIQKKRFWKTDYLYKVRYYSTFHIQDKYLKYYLDNLIAYKPEFMVGFPSTMVEIAKYGIRNNIIFPDNIIKSIFPTAETITAEIRQILTEYFHTKVADQYASSEGAPFIYECKHGNLHMELQSGVFEVLDENNKPADTGRLIVTSFTTYGTPLIRYDIGDQIQLATHKKCSCGNNNPLVEKIIGRMDDYIFSPETGKINLGNISNTLKQVHGIIKFQVIQNQLNEIVIKIIIDSKVFDKKSENKFISNWKDRIGNQMAIKLQIVDTIDVEKSGKFRIVKNNIKHLLDE